MTELHSTIDAYHAYSKEELESMEKEAIETAKQQIPQVAEANPEEVRAIVKRAMTMTDELEVTARSHKSHASEYTDIVLVLPGPGMYDSKLDPEIQDRYIDLPWSRNLNWARILTGAAFVRQVTAARLNKRTSDITKEDVQKHGPLFIYPSTSLEAEHLEHVLARPTTKIPREKVFMYTDVHLPDGTIQPIVNTADQVNSLRFPPDTPPPQRTSSCYTSFTCSKSSSYVGKIL